MADGTFAALLFLIGLTDMAVNDCPSDDGCLGRSDVSERFALSAGDWVARRASEQSELYLRYDLGHRFGPFGTSVGLSVAEGGETWVGIGQTLSYDYASGFFWELHAMPGFYFDNGGYDLGHPLEFRSGLEVGFEAGNGWRYGMSYDHRSNAGLFSDVNPGVETVQLRVSVPLN